MRSIEQKLAQLVIAGVMAAGCAPSEQGDDAASAEASYSNLSCTAQRPAIDALESQGFVRTEEGTWRVPLSSHDGTFSYGEVPLYRYEHADGRVSYAHCKHGVYGPLWRVKGVSIKAKGKWTYTPKPSTPSTRPAQGPVPVEVDVVVHDWRMSGSAIHFPADIEVALPRTELVTDKNRCPNKQNSCYLPVKLSAKDTSLRWSPNDEHGQSGSIVYEARPSRDEEVVSVGVRLDAKGAVVSLDATLNTYSGTWSLGL